jgi:hypothetical protein
VAAAQRDGHARHHGKQHRDPQPHEPVGGREAAQVGASKEDTEHDDREHGRDSEVEREPVTGAEPFCERRTRLGAHASTVSLIPPRLRRPAGLGLRTDHPRAAALPREPVTSAGITPEVEGNDPPRE